MREQRRKEKEMKRAHHEGRDASRPGPDLRRSAAQLGLAGSAGRLGHLGFKPDDDDDLMMFLRSSFKQRASRKPRRVSSLLDDDLEEEAEAKPGSEKNGLDAASGPRTGDVFEVARRHTRRGPSGGGGRALFRASSRRIMNAQRIAAVAKGRTGGGARAPQTTTTAANDGGRRITAKASLERFYAQADPSKVGNVEMILEKYGDDVEKLFASLEAKYPGMTIERPGPGGTTHKKSKRHLSFKDAGKKVGIVAATLGPTMRKKKIIKKAFARIDADGSGEIDWEEFYVACQTDDMAKARTLFKMLDEDGSGAIDRDELVHALRHDAQAFELAQSMAGLQTLFLAAKTQREEDKKRKRERRKSISERSSSRKLQRKRSTRKMKRRGTKRRLIKADGTAADDKEDALDVPPSAEDEDEGEWIEKVDPKSGRTYYANTVTKKSSWTKPVVKVVQAVNSFAAGTVRSYEDGAFDVDKDEYDLV